MILSSDTNHNRLCTAGRKGRVMRRRRVLALGTTALGLAGYGWYTATADKGFERVRSTSTSTSTPTSSSSTGPEDEVTTSPERTPTAVEGASIGGSLNGRPHLLLDNLPLVERSATNWMHAFLDVRAKYESGTDPRNDPDVETLRRLNRMGVNLVVSLRWNFVGIFGNKERTNVPPSGSSREASLYEHATELLDAIDGPVEVVVLGNEPIWETPDGDVRGKDSRLLAFTHGLKDHLVGNYTTGDPRLLVGSFNRLYDADVQNRYGQFYGQLFDMARNDDDIDGIDLHVHYAGLDQAETMLATARNEVPDGMITTTEFSPMWRYTRNTDAPIASFEGGREFIDSYGFPDDMTVREYFELAKDDPRPRGEMGEFMETMPWYNVKFVQDMHDLLTGYGAEVGTFGFLQDVGIRNAEWGEDWRPFQINYLFQRGLIATEDGAHPHYLDDFRGRT